eukprot:TRINITY_DN1304_c0_g1_i1.p1 TRINITY_DN1304_c0_g1~~TRINITY_DN1304_c0_g1_i1.p1  ORF type:complete len:121 (-),score=20.84 TRINITY_DN1304_c0_g1_i1:34-396(-)
MEQFRIKDACWVEADLDLDVTKEGLSDVGFQNMKSLKLKGTPISGSAPAPAKSAPQPSYTPTPITTFQSKTTTTTTSSPAKPAPTSAPTPAPASGVKKFCTECGTRSDGGAFCMECGNKL